MRKIMRIAHLMSSLAGFFIALLLHTAPSDALTISNISGGYNVTAANYTAFITYSGVVRDLYASGSAWDILGDDFQPEYPGIYLEQNGVAVAANTSINTSSSIKFINAGIGNWTYGFGENGFNITINLSGSSGDVQLFAVPDIDYMLRINQSGTNNYEDLSDGTGAIYAWNDVVYTTFENASLRMYLKDDAASGITRTMFLDGQQLWGLHDLGGPGSMSSGGNYTIIFSLDMSGFSPKPDDVNIAVTAGGFNVTTHNFSSTITSGGAMDNLTVAGSIWDILGDDLQQNPAGIYLANSTQSAEVINATN